MTRICNFIYFLITTDLNRLRFNSILTKKLVMYYTAGFGKRCCSKNKSIKAFSLSQHFNQITFYIYS